MDARKIEVRYIAERKGWKATVLGPRRLSAYGSDAEDALQYLSILLQIAPESWRLASKSKDRVLYELGSMTIRMVKSDPDPNRP